VRREPQVTARQGGTVNDLPATVTSALSHPVSTTTRSGCQVKLPVRFQEQRTKNTSLGLSFEKRGKL